jgi:hypothetical protein
MTSSGLPTVQTLSRRLSSTPSGPAAGRAAALAVLGLGVVAAVAVSVVSLTALATYRAQGAPPTALVAGVLVAGLLGVALRSGVRTAGVGTHVVVLVSGVVAAAGVVCVGLAAASQWPAESRTPAAEMTFDGTSAPALLIAESFATAAHLEPAPPGQGGWVLVVSAAPAYTSVPAAQLTLAVVDADGIERPDVETRTLDAGWSHVRLAVPASGCARVQVTLSPVAGELTPWSPRQLLAVCP